MEQHELSPHRIRKLFVSQLFSVYTLAEESVNEIVFKQKLSEYLTRNNELHSAAVKNILTLIENDGKNLFEFSKGEAIKSEAISLLWKFLTNRSGYEEGTVDLWFDLYHQFLALYQQSDHKPCKKEVLCWMKRWPTGTDPEVEEIRQRNKERIISLLVRKVENRHPQGNYYVFPEGSTEEEKEESVRRWWNEIRFQLTMAVKTPGELNRMLGHSLPEDVLQLYVTARKKGMPIFVTPYYLSLLNTTKTGYDDAAIRSYILYSPQLVNTFGNIRAWEKEDVVQAGKPNAAGWLVPSGHNIHRRYPEVAILIPDTMGRACGGLCASCQRMYDFQSKRLNFDFKELVPKENWAKRLGVLMNYFENDTQLRDILITGGDALMSRNKTLRNILDAVYKMALRKRDANQKRNDGEKYAELQRVRLGTRLPVYLPMRIDNELSDILRDFKEKASKIGVKQFVIQTHFQSPLEVTDEVRVAVRKILDTGWTLSNQLVYNVAASRRGHTAKLRKVLNELGIICYYTFSVKGFDENFAVFTPNSRSLQEQAEEKIIGRLDGEAEKEFLKLLKEHSDRAKAVRNFCTTYHIPFVATDRNLLNIPGIGKSMTFNMIGITNEGKRILQFRHDETRQHSPLIHKMGNIHIEENKSVLQYMLQLQSMGENLEEYAGIWHYTEGKTEKRFPLYNYPDMGFRITEKYSNLEYE